MATSRRHSWFRTIAASVSIVSFAGCATLFHGGGTQAISISTDPPGASVRVGAQEITSPGEVRLKRNRSYPVTASKEGYETATATINSEFSYLTLVDVIFIYPWVIDLTSGGAYNLSPDSVHLVLAPVPSVPASAPTPALSAHPAAAPHVSAGS